MGHVARPRVRPGRPTRPPGNDDAASVDVNVSTDTASLTGSRSRWGSGPRSPAPRSRVPRRSTEPDAVSSGPSCERASKAAADIAGALHRCGNRVGGDDTSAGAAGQQNAPGHW